MMYRNNKLLRLANEAPHCMCCLKHNDNDVVAAHANWSQYGKGMGLKSHDYNISFLCGGCHSNLDAGNWTREAQIAMWRDAHEKTIAWLFESGHLKVV